MPINSNRVRGSWAWELCLFRKSRGVLGSLRRTGPFCPHHCQRNGSAAASAPARSQRYEEGVLRIVFRHADENGLLLLDFGDLRSILQWTFDNSKELSGEYGNDSKQSVGAIRRQLLSFEAQGADRFFGEPALEIDDFLKVDASGRGQVGEGDRARHENSDGIGRGQVRARADRKSQPSQSDSERDHFGGRLYRQRFCRTDRGPVRAQSDRRANALERFHTPKTLSNASSPPFKPRERPDLPASGASSTRTMPSPPSILSLRSGSRPKK